MKSKNSDKSPLCLVCRDSVLVEPEGQKGVSTKQERQEHVLTEQERQVHLSYFISLIDLLASCAEVTYQSILK